MGFQLLLPIDHRRNKIRLRKTVAQSNTTLLLQLGKKQNTDLLKTSGESHRKEMKRTGQ